MDKLKKRTSGNRLLADEPHATYLSPGGQFHVVQSPGPRRRVGTQTQQPTKRTALTRSESDERRHLMRKPLGQCSMADYARLIELNHKRLKARKA